ncbi:hypothetical protein VZT92_008395 [Zoarces viviparus]|uniref:Uncharacterized protein n=1 Tax=Zoarces viviparus TaxID=48416 RepID=A0AAW1FFF8_ZOAVI
MNKMCVAYLGALLLTLHLIPLQVVQAQTPGPATNATTANKTETPPPKESGSGTTDCFTLLLPLAVAASLLHGWS